MVQEIMRGNLSVMDGRTDRGTDTRTDRRMHGQMAFYYSPPPIPEGDLKVHANLSE